MAIRGETIYEDLERNVARARAELDRAGEELQRATAELEQLRASEARELSRLAAVRLEELAARRVVDGLDRADRRALELLDRRRDAAERIDREIAASEQRQRQLSEERARAREQSDAARSAHDSRVEATRGRLAEIEAWQFQRARAERAASQAAHAEDKARQAETDRQSKGAAYEGDVLFSYLWERRFRYPEYRAIPLVRTLDQWVAGLCDYERAHRDYAMLLEIPVRLRAHADRLAAAATAEAEALLALEREALETDGVPALAAALAAAEEALAEVERRIDLEEQQHARQLEARGVLEAGRDPDTTAALRTLEAQLEDEDVATLREDARRTGSPEDDALVAAVADLRARQRRTEKELDGLRERQQAALASLRDLQEVRRRFRRRGYDADESFFDDDLDAGNLFGGLLRGALAVGEAWARLGRHQRFRRRSRSSGSSAFDILGGILSSGSSGSRSGGFGGGFGGGFRTGGGFGGGGGGFRTGGGF